LPNRIAETPNGIRFAKSFCQIKLPNALNEFESPNRVAKSNCQIELPNQIAKSICQIDPANRIAKSFRIAKFDMANRYAKSIRQIIPNQLSQDDGVHPRWTEETFCIESVPDTEIP
jgi:hypothetical protein